MPMTSAARRASLLSSMVQHPRAPERYDAGLRLRARCTPVTSCPASTARAAATAESTPPDIAARTFIRVLRALGPVGKPQKSLTSDESGQVCLRRRQPPLSLD